MHEHDHEYDQGEPGRPKPGRVAQPDLGRLAAAGAAGRLDVVGTGGLLGLQRVVGNSGVGALLEEDRSPVHDVVGSGGQPLAAGPGADRAAGRGHDFGDVGVHRDGAAHDSAVAVGAHAYTVGSDVFFQRDSYDPGSAQGRTTLAHELTHVVQQRSGPVDGTPAAGGIRVSDPADRFEQEAAATAHRAMQEPAVQRAEAPEDEPDEAPVQGLFLQRTSVQREDEEESAEE